MEWKVVDVVVVVDDTRKNQFNNGILERRYFDLTTTFVLFCVIVDCSANREFLGKSLFGRTIILALNHVSRQSHAAYYRCYVDVGGVRRRRYSLLPKIIATSY